MSTPVADPEAHQRDLQRYRRNLIVVAVISLLCGVAMGVFAIAPLREQPVEETLSPPVLRTAAPLATQSSVTNAPLVANTPVAETSGRSTAIEIETVDDSDLLNINTATVEQLVALPGIGETRAQDIIAHREAYGDFQSIQDITQVSGIGDGTLEKITPYITVGDVQD